MNTILITGFILGLSSSFHCIGMCGPIALAIPIKRDSKAIVAFQVLVYQFGRILTYSFLGIIIGFFGMSIQAFGILQWLSIISGILIILFAWKKYIPTIPYPKKFNLTTKISQLFFGKILKSNSRFKLFLLGMVNGILPCGVVYLALINALIAPNILQSSLSMFLFGLGTLPAMFIVSFSASKIKQHHSLTIKRALPYFMTLIGLIIVLRGMNLGIPYLSPKIQLKPKTTTSINKNNCSEKEVTVDCCHKNNK